MVRGWVVLAVLLGMCTTGRPGDNGWDTYGNARFGFSVCYPRTLLRPRGESDNGDGNTFKTVNNQATVVVYGSYGMTGEGGPKALAEQFADTVKGQEQKGYKITYKMLKSRVYAYSGVSGEGTPGARIVYEKTFETTDHRLISIEAEYPDSMKATLNPVVAKMAGCLTAGNVDYQ